MVKTKKKRNKLVSALRFLVLLGLLGALVVLGINLWVTGSVKDQILSMEEAIQLQDVDCIIVLGCQVHADGTPSAMLEDRLLGGIRLYQQGAAPKLLLSGDHGTEQYDEVNAMRDYALAAGVPSADVFMDHAGFSTYDTVYRAKAIFGAKKVLIVTQQYHLSRTLYIANALGLEAYGFASDYRDYGSWLYNNGRECLARVKDFGMAILQPKPTFLGDPIPLTGDGSLTHDENS